MINQSNYLDVGKIYINEIIGDVTLALIILLIATIYVLTRWGVKGEVIGIIIFMEACVFAGIYLGLGIVWVVLLIIISAALYHVYKTMNKT